MIYMLGGVMFIYIAVNHNYIVWDYRELPYFTKSVTTIGDIFLKEKNATKYVKIINLR